jgi:hypothetical protein
MLVDWRDFDKKTSSGWQLFDLATDSFTRLLLPSSSMRPQKKSSRIGFTLRLSTMRTGRPSGASLFLV